MQIKSDHLHSRAYDFWFAPFAPGLLGFCRALLFALMIWFYWPMDYAPWGDLPHSMLNNRIFVFRLMHLHVASHDFLVAWQLVWKISLLTACVGFFTRTSVWIATIGGFYLFSLPGNFGKIGHGEGILFITILILALSKCGDAWSIDVLRRAWRARDPSAQRVKIVSGEYRWPIRMVWLLMSMVMLGAGITKLRIGGLDWVRTDNLSTTILQHYYGMYSTPPTQLGVWIAQHRELCKIVAGATIFIELFFFLAMFSALARAFFVPAMFLAQVGIYVMMGISFTQFMFVYIFWISWDCMGRSIQKLFAQRGNYVMLYDGGCGLCKSVASVVAHLDLLNRIELIDVLHDWDAVQARFPSLNRQDCLTDIHMISPSGKVFTRFESYREIAWAMPITWIILPLLYVPPVPAIADRVYGYIAIHRHDDGCELPQ